MRYLSPLIAILDKSFLQHVRHGFIWFPASATGRLSQSATLPVQIFSTAQRADNAVMETGTARNGDWRLFPSDTIGKRRMDHPGNQAPPCRGDHRSVAKIEDVRSPGTISHIIFSSSYTASQYGGLLTSSCCPSVCPSVCNPLHRGGFQGRCTGLTLIYHRIPIAGKFLFVPSYTFAVGWC